MWFPCGPKSFVTGLVILLACIAGSGPCDLDATNSGASCLCLEQWCPLLRDPWSTCSGRLQPCAPASRTLLTTHFLEQARPFPVSGWSLHYCFFFSSNFCILLPFAFTSRVRNGISQLLPFFFVGVTPTHFFFLLLERTMVMENTEHLIVTEIKSSLKHLLFCRDL